MKFVNSPNYNDRPDGIAPCLLIIHYTGTRTAQEADEVYRTANHVSPHYMVDRDGDVTHYVDETKRAWHAGLSAWAQWDDINAVSIGIECVNHGHDFGVVPEPFSDQQIQSLCNLIQSIRTRYMIADRYILGHSDVAVGRKIDPGEAFPWRDLAKHNIGLWPRFDQSAPADFDITQGLHDFGYRYAATLTQTITEFQRHYVPDDFLDAATRGNPTQKTKTALYSLLQQISEQ